MYLFVLFDDKLILTQKIFFGVLDRGREILSILYNSDGQKPPKEYFYKQVKTFPMIDFCME